jgi:hypothetical protein
MKVIMRKYQPSASAFKDVAPDKVVFFIDEILPRVRFVHRVISGKVKAVGVAGLSHHLQPLSHVVNCCRWFCVLVKFLKKISFVLSCILKTEWFKVKSDPFSPMFVGNAMGLP